VKDPRASKWLLRHSLNTPTIRGSYTQIEEYIDMEKAQCSRLDGRFWRYARFEIPAASPILVKHKLQYMEASMGLIVGMLIAYYAGSMLVYSAVATLVINAISRKGKVKFLRSFLHSMGAALVGVLASVVVYALVLRASETPDEFGFDENTVDQTMLAIYCVTLQIGIIIMLSIFSFKSQLRASRQAGNRIAAT
jgi:hypothetical protein